MLRRNGMLIVSAGVRPEWIEFKGVPKHLII